MEKKMQIVISGTPQIGKSTFLSYMLVEMQKKTNFRKIFVVSNHVSSNGHRWTMPRGRDRFASVIDFLDDPENGKYGACHYLSGYKYQDERLFASQSSEATRGGGIAFLDGYSSVPTFYDHYHHLVVFTSQAFTQNLKANQLWPTPQNTLYMPTWTVEEMSCFREKHPKAFDNDLTIKYLYDHFGGSIGYCVCTPYLVEHFIRQLYHQNVFEMLQKFHGQHSELMSLGSKNHPAALIKINPDSDFSLRM